MPVPKEISKSEACEYELYGVVNHSGSLGGGHYKSEAKNKNNWYQFDGDSVTKLGLESPLQKEAYLLFYKRKL